MPTILTNEQAQERLNSSRNLVSRFGREKASSVNEVDSGQNGSHESNVTIIPLQRPGRTDGSPNFTTEEKVDIATRTGLGERLSSVARSENTTASVVRNIHLGHTHVDREAVEERIAGVQDVALLKLMASLNFIDDEKLKKLNAKDLGNFAASMSKVVHNTLASEKDPSQVHVHLYAPELRKEASFKTIEVRGA